LLTKNIKIKVYGTVIAPVVLYGSETWSVTVRAENRLRVYSNTIVRKASGPKSGKVRVYWRKLHSEELQGLYCSLAIIRVTTSRKIIWAENVARIGKMRMYIGFLW
jgi:hypothetical protein